MYATRSKKRNIFGNITNTDIDNQTSENIIETNNLQDDILSKEENSIVPILSEACTSKHPDTGIQCKPESNSASNIKCTYSLRSHGNIHTFTREDALKNCENWVSLHSSELNKHDTSHEPSNKKPRLDQIPQVATCTLEEQDVDSPGALDSYSKHNDVDESVSSSFYQSANYVPKVIKISNLKLKLRCEWKHCHFLTDKLEIFVCHVSEHIPQLELRVNEDDEEVYVCQWRGCGFETDDSKEVVRHVNFHSYHTKIKSIGATVLRQSNVPPCQMDSEGKNLLPDLPEPFECCWEDCDKVVNNSQKFFFHVHTHVMANPRGRHVKGGIDCEWRGCKYVARTVYKLSDHIRTHTHEKQIGCPNCGSLFASKTKFLDHCRSQIPLELQGYQCSHCSKFYPSERLLRDHMRHHINHYKCSFCDMTCPRPSSLTLHIRYRHLDSKPFNCQFCHYAAKTQYDLKSHLDTHCDDPIYICDEEDCTFSCRSSHTLNKHFRKEHAGGDEAVYCCHICDSRFHRGTHLTKHLFGKHSFRWPSGHCRFRYKHDEDGYYRLQTVRYESLEVTQEIMQAEVAANPLTEKELQSRRYALRSCRTRSQDIPNFHITMVDDDDEELKSRNNVFITIEEMDEKGNVISSKLIEPDNTIIMPSEKMTVIADGSEMVEELDVNCT